MLSRSKMIDKNNPYPHMPAISTPLSHFVQGSHSKQLAPGPQDVGTRSPAQLVFLAWSGGIGGCSPGTARALISTEHHRARRDGATTRYGGRAQVPTSWGPGANCFGLALNPDCTFARPLEGVGSVWRAEFFSKLILESARGGPKPGSYAYYRYPVRTSPKCPIPVYVTIFWHVFAIL